MFVFLQSYTHIFHFILNWIIDCYKAPFIKKYYTFISVTFTGINWFLETEITGEKTQYSTLFFVIINEFNLLNFCYEKYINCP